MKRKLLAVLLLALAAALLIGHVRIPYGTRAWYTEQSAAALREGERISVPGLQGDVDVNAATAEELEALVDVGPLLAEAIIAEREKNGPFYYLEDQLNVKGIGEKTLVRMQKQLKLP